jgi:hypothetical protein
MNKQELVIELQANEAEFQRVMSQGNNSEAQLSEARNRRAQLRAELLKNLRTQEEENINGMMAALADANEELDRMSNEIDEQAKQTELEGHHEEALATFNTAMENAIAAGDTERIVQLDRVHKLREERAAKRRAAIAEQLRKNEADAKDEASRARRNARREELMKKLRAENEESLRAAGASMTADAAVLSQVTSFSDSQAEKKRESKNEQDHKRLADANLTSNEEFSNLLVSAIQEGDADRVTQLERLRIKREEREKRRNERKAQASQPASATPAVASAPVNSNIEDRMADVHSLGQRYQQTEAETADRQRQIVLAMRQLKLAEKRLKELRAAQLAASTGGANLPPPPAE